MKLISRDRISTFFQVLLVIFLFCYSAVKGNPESNKDSFQQSAVNYKGDDALHNQMLELWKQHVVWNRNVMLCIVDNLPGTLEAVDRLQQNKIDIGNAIKPFYGTASGEELTRLLQEHVRISVEVMLYATEKKRPQLHEANARWHANANDIATFLAAINSYWASDKMQLMIKEQLRLTTTQAILRINKDYAADIIAYDKAQSHSEMAEIFAAGITSQFPEKVNPVAQVRMINQ